MNNRKYLETLIDSCWCLAGYTPERLEEDLDRFNLNELTGNLWEDIPFIQKELPFALKNN